MLLTQYGESFHHIYVCQIIKLYTLNILQYNWSITPQQNWGKTDLLMMISALAKIIFKFPKPSKGKKKSGDDAIDK